MKAVDQIYRLACHANKSDACELWFRGVKSTTYHLTPSIAKGSARRRKSSICPSSARWPKTRLLDWSREALVASLFALGEPVNDVERNHDKVVWVLDPVRLNKAFRFYKFLKPGYIPNVTEPAFNALFGPNAKNDKAKPAAAIGPLNNPRIIKPAGTFTVFPRSAAIVPLDELPDSYKYLYKIVIRKRSPRADEPAAAALRADGARFVPGHSERRRGHHAGVDRRRAAAGAVVGRTNRFRCQDRMVPWGRHACTPLTPLTICVMRRSTTALPSAIASTRLSPYSSCSNRSPSPSRRRASETGCGRWSERLKWGKSRGKRTDQRTFCCPNKNFDPGYLQTNWASILIHS